MLDHHTHRWARQLLAWPARALQGKIHPDTLTLMGFGVGMIAVPLITLGWFKLALGCVLANRLLDGLDGALARQHGITDWGGFLDIGLDFVFYGAVVMGFALHNPADALAAAFLLFGFLCNGSLFLAFALLCAKHGHMPDQPKSFVFIYGLAEGTETIVFFVLFCLWPTHFAFLAWGFGVLCCVSAGLRFYQAHRQFRTPRC